MKQACAQQVLSLAQESSLATSSHEVRELKHSVGDADERREKKARGGGQVVVVVVEEEGRVGKAQQHLPLPGMSAARDESRWTPQGPFSSCCSLSSIALPSGLAEDGAEGGEEAQHLTDDLWRHILEFAE